MRFESIFDYSQMSTDRLQSEIEQAAVGKVTDLVLNAAFHKDLNCGLAVDDVEQATAKLAYALVLQGNIEGFAEAESFEGMLKAARIGTAVLHVVDREQKTMPVSPLKLESQVTHGAELPVFVWSRNPARDELEIMAHLLNAPEGIELDTDVRLALSLANLEVLAEQNPHREVLEEEVSPKTEYLIKQYMERTTVKDMDVAVYRSACGKYLFQLMFESNSPAARSNALQFDETDVTIHVVNEDKGSYGTLTIDREHPDDTCGIRDSALHTALIDFLESDTTQRISEIEFEDAYLTCVDQSEEIFIRIGGKKYGR